MHTLVFSFILAAVAAYADKPAGNRTLATAEAAVARITPLAPGRDFVQLPALEFALNLRPRCPNAADAAAVSISVADTQVALTFTAADAAETVATALTLPRAQAGPVRISGFCRAGQADTARELLIQGAFSARVSLRCSASDSDSISYSTLPLDVILACDRSDQDH